MKLSCFYEGKHPKYNKPNYISDIYDSTDGESRFKEVIDDAKRGSDRISKHNTSIGGIYVFYAGKGSSKKILVTAGLHGNECIGPKVASMVLSTREIPSEASVMVIPIMNPDGFIGLHRKNAKDEDSNRSFNKAENPYKSIQKAILDFKPTICIDLHEWHESDGCFAYTNIEGLEEKIAEIINYSGMSKTEKKKIHGEKVQSGTIYSDVTKNDGTLIDWLNSKKFRYILPEAKTESDPWSQITYFKLIIDLAFSV